MSINPKKEGGRKRVVGCRTIAVGEAARVAAVALATLEGVTSTRLAGTAAAAVAVAAEAAPAPAAVVASLVTVREPAGGSTVAFA
jgi:hypothetical protein